MRISMGGVRRAAAILSVATIAPALMAAPAAAVPDPLTPTETQVQATPEFSLVNTTVSFTVDVTLGVLPSGVYPPIGGKVTLSHGQDQLPGCIDVTVVAGKASCQSPAPATTAYRSIDAHYAGDENYAASHGSANHFTVEPAQVTAKVNPNPVERSATIEYGATVAIVQFGSVGVAAVSNLGTAAFFVDGVPVDGCAAQLVSHNGLAKCPAKAPAVAGGHTLKVIYTGFQSAGSGQAEAPFDVIGPDAKVSDAVAFGPAALGTTVQRSVTLTSAGKVALTLSRTALQGDGSFSIVSDGCAAGTLAHGATCEVVVAYRPTVAGAHTATLGFDHDAGSSTVTLSGTGVAPAVETPTPPTATPTPVAGATIDPDRKPTFTVSVPSGNNARASSVPTLKLPLTCPANSECELDGKLTIEQSALKSAKARASAASTQTVAKFSRVQVEAGGLKTVKLKLSRSFVKSAQKRGIRRIRATLTINTVLGSGEKITTAQRITIVLPKAAKKAAAKQQVRPRFTG